MKIFLSIKYHPDQRNRARIEAISQALAAQGHTVWCVVRDLEHWGEIHLDPPALMHATFELIAASDALYVDLTEKGVGVGIEAGYACALPRPVVVLAERNAGISETLIGIAQKVIQYDGIAGIASALNQDEP